MRHGQKLAAVLAYVLLTPLRLVLLNHRPYAFCYPLLYPIEAAVLWTYSGGGRVLGGMLLLLTAAQGIGLIVVPFSAARRRYWPFLALMGMGVLIRLVALVQVLSGGRASAAPYAWGVLAHGILFTVAVIFFLRKCAKPEAEMEKASATP